MAIVKVANRSGTKVGKLIDYVMDTDKLKCVSVSGLITTDMSPEVIKEQMMETKRCFDKLGGRECYHIIISYHYDEQITPEEANEYAQEWFSQIPEFQDHEALFATQIHPNGNGCIHTHIVVNSVDFMDGSKLHTDKEWLQDIKDISDDVCREHDLEVCEKGKDFYGNDIDRNEPWDMTGYLMKHDLAGMSFKDEIANDVEQAAKYAFDKDEFISTLRDDYGIEVVWTDTRKYITFIDEDGHRIRDNKLEKDYGLQCDKDSLLQDFERNFENYNDIDTNEDNSADYDQTDYDNYDSYDPTDYDDYDDYDPVD